MNTPAENDLIPFNAKFLRVYPTSGHKHMSMRYEVYGPPAYDDGEYFYLD